MKSCSAHHRRVFPAAESSAPSIAILSGESGIAGQVAGQSVRIGRCAWRYKIPIRVRAPAAGQPAVLAGSSPCALRPSENRAGGPALPAAAICFREAGDRTPSRPKSRRRELNVVEADMADGSISWAPDRRSTCPGWFDRGFPAACPCACTRPESLRPRSIRIAVQWRRGRCRKVQIGTSSRKSGRRPRPEPVEPQRTAARPSAHDMSRTGAVAENH